MITVEVPIPGRRYDVLVGHGARHELAGLLPSVGASGRRSSPRPGVPLELDPGIPFERFEIGAGEEHKTLATIEALCRGFARMGLTRNDVVIAHGGGIVTDVGGFAAAAWHRGVPVVHVTTTLLGMVDAAIGGKTGRQPARGQEPRRRDLAAERGDLRPRRARPRCRRAQWRCGRGEMAKYHFLTGDDLLALDEPERIARCVAIKADVVAGDEREDPDGGARALLNYGHTLAHALEIATHHELEHGEAVAIGLVYAAHLARLLDRIDDAAVQHHYDVVAGAYELDTALPAGLDPDELVDADGSRQEGGRLADVRPRRRARRRGGHGRRPGGRPRRRSAMMA